MAFFIVNLARIITPNPAIKYPMKTASPQRNQEKTVQTKAKTTNSQTAASIQSDLLFRLVDHVDSLKDIPRDEIIASLAFESIIGHATAYGDNEAVKLTQLLKTWIEDESYDPDIDSSDAATQRRMVAELVDFSRSLRKATHKQMMTCLSWKVFQLQYNSYGTDTACSIGERLIEKGLVE